MKPTPKIQTIICVTLALLYTPCFGAEASQFKPGKVWRDNNGVHINAHGGGVMLHGDTYYWFGEHKIAGKAGNTAQVGVHVYSSKDLYHWKDEGIALNVSKDPKSEITKGCIMERPKVIYNAKTPLRLSALRTRMITSGVIRPKNMPITTSSVPTLKAARWRGI